MSIIEAKDYRYPVKVSEEIPFGDFVRIRKVLQRIQTLFPREIPSDYVKGKECVQFLVRDHEQMCLPLPAYKTFVSLTNRLKESSPEAYDKILSTIRVQGVTGIQALPYYLDFISGVPAMFLWTGTGEFDKFSLLLVGDYHRDSKLYSCKDCTDTRCEQYFPNVVDTIIKNTIGTIDLFLEFPFIDKAYKRDRAYSFQKGTMFDTFEYFSECLKRDKTECQKRWPNLRVHYSDIREDLAEKPKTMIHILQDFESFRLQLQDYKTKDKNQKEILRNISITLERIRPLLDDAPPTVRHLMEYIRYVFGLNIIRKQTERKNASKLHIDKIGEVFFNNTKAHLESFAYSHQLQKLKSELDESIKMALSLQAKNRDTPEYEQGKDAMVKQFSTLYSAMTIQMRDAFLMMGSLMIDTYLLLRLFKPYDGLQKQAIVYCGYSHIHFYHQVLQRIGFNMIYHRQNIDISTMREPALEQHKTFCLQNTGQFIL